MESRQTRLRSRFAIDRVCVVADRGMISAATITALEQRGLEYILGVRERGSKEVREVCSLALSPSDRGVTDMSCL